MISILWGWVAAAFVFGALEVLLPSFGLIFASSSAVAAGLAGLAGAPFEGQLAVFGSALLAQLFLLRPRLLRLWNNTKAEMPSRAGALIGKRGRISSLDEARRGRATFAGEDWAIESSEELAIGDEVEAVKADGIVLRVRKG